MTQKSWDTMGYIIDFKNGSRCVFFFSEKGAMSNFFFEKGELGQKRLGTCGLDSRLTDGWRFYLYLYYYYPPLLWSGGQTSWLQIQRTGLDSREVVGLEPSPLSLVSTT
jgi:hypothetical protein